MDYKELYNLCNWLPQCDDTTVDGVYCETHSAITEDEKRKTKSSMDKPDTSSKFRAYPAKKPTT